MNAIIDDKKYRIDRNSHRNSHSRNSHSPFFKCEVGHKFELGQVFPIEGSKKYSKIEINSFGREYKEIIYDREKDVFSFSGKTMQRIYVNKVC